MFSLLSYHTSTCFRLLAAHYQEIECIYLANGTCYTSELTVIGPGPLTVNSGVQQVSFAEYIHSTS
jgi:hypothetical protein